MILRVATWSVHDLSFLNPACSSLNLLSVSVWEQGPSMVIVLDAQKSVMSSTILFLSPGPFLPIFYSLSELLFPTFEVSHDDQGVSSWYLVYHALGSGIGEVVYSCSLLFVST